MDQTESIIPPTDTASEPDPNVTVYAVFAPEVEERHVGSRKRRQVMLMRRCLGWARVVKLPADKTSQ